MGIEIHPQAIVSPEAKIGEGTKVGPFSIIGPQVVIGKNNKIHSHVILDGIIEMGDENEIYQFSSLGAPPQDKTYKGEPTKVVIGNRNIMREYVSIHRGTLKEHGLTQVGDDNFLMAHVHLGHDVILGDRCVFANSVNLAGHVKVGTGCIIGGGTNISQFVGLGRASYIGGASAIDKDVPPFCTAVGNRIKLKGINIIGLRRQGHSKQVITEVLDFFRDMESSALSPKSFIKNDDWKKVYEQNDLVQEMVQAISNSDVGLAPFN